MNERHVDDPEHLPSPDDSESGGLDLHAAQTWIYPTNYPVREYQYNIVEKALHKNTLVSLPTGLGKTFIAAVVMYNFYRWFPSGKVIFIAPTKPLVRQQVEACYDIMGIPKEVTEELTGTKQCASREEIWREKRVFFITPQILQNDLDKIPWLAQKIKCIVLDEAHKARGNHAYCEVIRKLQSVDFRVLALSATPGASINDCLEIIQNLLISHLEFRTEESPDVKPYIFERNLTTALVPLDEKLQQVKDDYLKVLDVYTRILVQHKVLQGSYGNISKGKIFITLNNFRLNSKRHPKYNEITKSLNICITLYHAYELLIRHGLRSFYNFFEEHLNKPLLKGNVQILEIMEDIRQHLGPPLQMELLPDGNYTEVSKDTRFGHPKFYKLHDILVQHFQEKGDGSKVIVFFEYRESVLEAFALLNQSRPLLKPRVFLGQKNGITQKLQLNVVKAFRDGSCNLLLSTCIGEEGIDVGNVDLIVCFDISNKSPIRMVQRMGRTGRKKEGSIVVLVTEGKEQQTLRDCLMHKNNVTYHVLNSSEISKGLVRNNPDMLAGVVPKCEKIYITVKRAALQKNSSLKELFKRVTFNEVEFSPDLDLTDVPERLPKTIMLWNKKDPLNAKADFSGIFSRKITKQRSFQDGYKVQHSKDSQLLVSLLQLSDSKRFNIPTTQVEGSSQKNLKQIDIRKMFGNSQNPQDFMSPASQGSKPESSTSQEDKHITAPKYLFDEISQFLSINLLSKTCRHCPDYAHCEKTVVDSTANTINWIELEESIFTSITAEDLNAFSRTLRNVEDIQFDCTINFSKLEIPDHIPTQLDKSVDTSVGFVAPKTFDLLLNRYSTSMVVSDEPLQSQVEETSNCVTNPEDPNLILRFFKLNTLSDLFEEKESSSLSEQTIIYSPDLFDCTNTRSINRSGSSTSPVLVRSSSLQSAKRNINQVDSQPDLPLSNTTSTSPILNKKSRSQTDPNFSLNSTKRYNPLLTNHSGSPVLNKSPGVSKVKQNIDHVNLFSNRNKSYLSSTPLVEALKDFCDMSIFEFDSPKSVTKEVKNDNAIRDIDFGEIEDICDISLLKDFKKFCSRVEKEEKSEVLNKRMDVTNPVDETSAKSFCSRVEEEKNETMDFTNPVEENEETNVRVIENERNSFWSRVEKKDKNPVLNKKLILSDSINENQDAQKSTPSLLSITAMLSYVNKSNDNDPTMYTSSQRENTEQERFPIPNSPSLKRKKVSSQSRSSHEKPNAVSIPKSPDIHDFTFNDKRTPRKRLFTPSKTSPIHVKAGKVEEKQQRYDSDDDFEPKPIMSPARFKQQKKVFNKKIDRGSKKKEPVVLDFIEKEADVSKDCIIISDDEDEENMDCYEKSFVADDTFISNTQVHVNYLQSTRSPLLNRGKFKIPIQPKVNVDVFSQEFQQDETYLNDSFVVDEEDDASEKLSQLEIMELELERKKKSKKSLKRKRIIEISSDDSE